MEFDPQEWESLARSDPEEFNRRRQAAIAAVIARAPQPLQDRLRGLQFRVDLELRRARTPLAGALRLHGMMWDRFEMLRATLNGQGADGCVTGDAVVPAAGGLGNVLPFARRS
jgi:hypothetical protein